MTGKSLNGFSENRFHDIMFYYVVLNNKKTA